MSACSSSGRPAKMYHEWFERTQEPGAVGNRGWQEKNRWNGNLGKKISILLNCKPGLWFFSFFLFESEYLIWEDLNWNSLGVTLTQVWFWKLSSSNFLFVAFFYSQTTWREDSCVEPVVLLMKMPVQKPAYIMGQTCHKAQATSFTKVVLTRMLCELVYGSWRFLGIASV